MKKEQIMAVILIIFITTIVSIGVLCGGMIINWNNQHQQIASDTDTMVKNTIGSVYYINNESDTSTDSIDLSVYNVAPKIHGSEPFNSIFTIHTDLLNRENISEMQMNNIICELIEESTDESNLEGTGQAFIYASQQTGYDPLFLLALIIETNGYVVNKNDNGVYDPYGIGDYDGGYVGEITGTTLESAIINGAIYMYEDYYVWCWETTLEDMAYGSGNLKYPQSKGEHWAYNIATMLTKEYNILHRKD